MSEETKKILREKGREDLIKVMEINDSGHAGVMPNGNIVDRRRHPEAVPVQENKMMGIPAPKDRSAAEDGQQAAALAYSSVVPGIFLEFKHGLDAHDRDVYEIWMEDEEGTKRYVTELKKTFMRSWILSGENVSLRNEIAAKDIQIAGLLATNKELEAKYVAVSQESADYLNELNNAIDSLPEGSTLTTRICRALKKYKVSSLSK